MSFKSKPATTVTHKSAGGGCTAPVTISAPAVKPERKIAGFGATKVAGGRSTPTARSGPGTSSPTQKVTARGGGQTGRGAPGKRMSGGSSQPGPTPRGGTSAPKHGSGPGGLGLSGSKFPPIG